VENAEEGAMGRGDGAVAQPSSSPSPAPDASDIPLHFRSLHMAFVSAMLGVEYAFEAVIRLAEEIFQMSEQHTPHTIMLAFTPQDFILDGELIPVGSTGDSPSQKLYMDLFERWVWIMYLTLMELGVIPGQPSDFNQQAPGVGDFVHRTLKLYAEEQSSSIYGAKGDEDPTSETFTADGWVHDPFVRSNSSAVAVMKQQTFIIRRLVEKKGAPSRNVV